MRLPGILIGSALLGYFAASRGRTRNLGLMIAGLCVAVSVALPATVPERRRVRVEDGDALLSILAHELRSPLSAVRGALLLLWHPEQLEPGRREEVLAIAEDATERIARIVDDALNAVRIGRDGLTFEWQPVDLEAVVGDAIRAASARRSAPIRLAAQNGLPPARGDRIRVRQVVTNLLDNAVAHAGDGSEVIVSIVAEGEHLRCTIHNEGAGIPPARLPALFRPFTPETDRPESVGLGLSIAKRLVEAMGGTIGFDPTPGRHATFWFTLPVYA
jgi:signal transduction histidine kinase